MANNTFTNFFKVITPTTAQTSTVQDNQHIDGSSVSTNNYSWYQRLLVGSATRLHRYMEYDIMDNDIDISRALDTIAEEMTNSNTTDDLLFDLVITNDDEIEMDHNTVLTIKTALRFWTKVHQLDTKIFKICRNTIKMGDCFFRRIGKNKTWEWITPANVIAAVVDEHDVTKIIGFQIKVDNKSVGGAEPIVSKSNSPNNKNSTGYQSMYATTEFVHISDIIRFTLNDDMSETAPFGESILKTVYKTYKQKELLEDATIIYRIQKAPMRRVFKIDVGKMPQDKVKRYLEQVKNEMRQKNIPSHNSNGQSMDSVYNPTSMLEDIYLAQRADGKGSSVDILQGDQNSNITDDLMFFMKKLFRGLRIPMAWSGLDDVNNAIFNDGKVGAAYIEEQRFAKYVKRLQANISTALDSEFKIYLRHNGIHIDNTLFHIKLPEPSNFEVYRQAEMDSMLLSTYSNADNIQYLSKQFIMQRYLQLSEEEIVRNEQLLKQEKGITEDIPTAQIAHIMYGDAINTGGMGDMSGMGDIGGMGNMGNMGDIGGVSGVEQTAPTETSPTTEM